LPQSLLSPSRRWAALVALLASGAVLVVVLNRGEDTAASPALRGNVNACVSLTGEAARTCYAREVALELAAVGGTAGTPQVMFEAPSDSTSTVTFATAASADTSAALLCDLHLRVGVTEADSPSWVSWNESPVS
jgi:hypothetical protein